MTKDTFQTMNKDSSTDMIKDNKTQSLWISFNF